jgi:hypothetical protein
MAYSHDAVIQAQWQQLAAERSQAVSDYEAGRTAEDEFSTMTAADRILQAESKIAALDRVSAAYGQQQAAHAQQQRQNPYGLSDDERAIAHGNGQGDPRLSNADRERIYAEQKARYQQARRDGSYRDDQGRVTR